MIWYDIIWYDNINIHVCVCVSHLNRCKTSTFRDFIFVWNNFSACKTMQGACGHHANACQRSYAWWWKPGLITLVYLHFRHSSFWQIWHGAKPRTPTPIYQFSLLHGRRNLTNLVESITHDRQSSPIFCLEHFRRFIADDNNLVFNGFIPFYSILLFVMTIQDMVITQENFHYS